MEKKISFGFGSSSASRRPGLSKANTSLTTLQTETKEQKTTVNVDPPLVIPLAEGERYQKDPLSTPPTAEIIKPFDKEKFGLQIRHPKKTVNTEKVDNIEDMPIWLRKRLGKRGAEDDEEFRKNASKLSNVPDMAAYERIPVEEFGFAMLRGMGWKGEPKTISKSKDDFVTSAPRPKRLGLGADPKQLNKSKTATDKKFDFVKVNENDNDNVKQLTQDEVEPVSGPSWLIPHIKVKIISSKTVGVVLDTHMDDDGVVRAVVRLPDGRLISDLHAGQVEPIRPSIGKRAITITGESGIVVKVDGTIAHMHLSDSLEIISCQIERLIEHM